MYEIVMSFVSIASLDIHVDKAFTILQHIWTRSFDKKQEAHCDDAAEAGVLTVDSFVITFECLNNHKGNSDVMCLYIIFALRQGIFSTFLDCVLTSLF